MYIVPLFATVEQKSPIPWSLLAVWMDALYRPGDLSGDILAQNLMLLNRPHCFAGSWFHSLWDHRESCRDKKWGQETFFHPRVTNLVSLSFLPGRSRTEAWRVSTQLFPSLLNLSCASGSEMEWISSGGWRRRPTSEKTIWEEKSKGSAPSWTSLLSSFLSFFLPDPFLRVCLDGGWPRTRAFGSRLITVLGKCQRAPQM